MSLFVDTSAWSLAFRRDGRVSAPEAGALVDALEHGEMIVTTGIVLQELLQGFNGPKAREQLLGRFSALPFVMPERRDHVDAAGLRNTCRRGGLQIATIDALLAQLCIRHGLTMLTTDGDFAALARHSRLKLWRNA